LIFSGTLSIINLTQVSESSEFRFTLHNIWDSYWGPISWADLILHPSFTFFRENANVVFVDMYRKEASIQQMLALPARAKHRPYVLWSHGINLDICTSPFEKLSIQEQRLCIDARKLMNRDDVLFVNYDLRDFSLCDDSFEVHGVSIPPFDDDLDHAYGGLTRPKGNGHPAREALGKTSKYLLTFRGSVSHHGWFGSASVRPDLKRSFRYMRDPRVVIEFPEPPYTEFDQQRWNDLLWNTSYALVPHGDGRWNFRLGEIVGACVIPVFLARGLTLPFEQIIDWSEAAILLNESLAKDPSSLLAQLPQDPMRIKYMRERVCDINDAFFRSVRHIIDALLLALRKQLNASTQSRRLRMSFDSKCGGGQLFPQQVMLGSP
jgi:hypothetical protein